MSNYMPYNQNQAQQFQPYQATQYFPQPQGSIYMIASSNDVANVPVGAGLSAAICLREGIKYLKTIQNGSPMLLGYRLSSLEGTEPQQEQNKTSSCEIDKKITAILKDYGDRITKVEQYLETSSKVSSSTNDSTTSKKDNGGISGWVL